MTPCHSIVLSVFHFFYHSPLEIRKRRREEKVENWKFSSQNYHNNETRFILLILILRALLGELKLLNLSIKINWVDIHWPDSNWMISICDPIKLSLRFGRINLLLQRWSFRWTSLINWFENLAEFELMIIWPGFRELLCLGGELEYLWNIFIGFSCFIKICFNYFLYHWTEIWNRPCWSRKHIFWFCLWQS